METLNMFIDYTRALGFKLTPDPWLLQVGSMGIAIILVAALWLWHTEKQDRKKRLLYVPVTPIAKEYGELYTLIGNAKSKRELQSLEQRSIEFKMRHSQHECKDELFEKLSLELRAKRYFLTLSNNTSLKVR